VITGSVAHRGGGAGLLFHRGFDGDAGIRVGALVPEAFAEREVRDTKNEDRTHCDPENCRFATPRIVAARVSFMLRIPHTFLFEQRAAGTMVPSASDAEDWGKTQLTE
jgi:hypothetical protein